MTISIRQRNCLSIDNDLCRLVSFNYPTAAAAASDLGGIEIAKSKAAMTIGLSTITMNRNVKAIIMAAGEGKADVVKAAVELHASASCPASVLHSISGSIFYITHGAALKLNRSIDRRMRQVTPDCYDWIKSAEIDQDIAFEQPPKSFLVLEEFLHNSSMAANIPLNDLQLRNLESRPGASHLLKWLDEKSLHEICAFASSRLASKIFHGLKSTNSINKTYMHTAPHHDDIMLSYHGAMHYILGRQPVPDESLIKLADDVVLGERFNGNKNYFAYLTSGFHSVNDSFLHSHLQRVNSNFISAAYSRGDLTCSNDELLARFREAFPRRDVDAMTDIESLLFLRKLMEVYNLKACDSLCEDLINRLVDLRKYLDSHQPGDAVPK